jgi:hypothetical protein
MPITINGSGTITGATTLATALVNPVVTTTMGVGNATPAATGAGITFPAAVSASSDANTLDDYEEGTWAPSDQSGAGLTLVTNAATYTKIGRLVTCNMAITYPVTASVLTAIIGGLPFTSGNYGSATIQGYITATTAVITMRGIYAGASRTTFLFDKNNAVAVATNVDLSNSIIYATIIYQV